MFTIKNLDTMVELMVERNRTPSLGLSKSKQCVMNSSGLATCSRTSDATITSKVHRGSRDSRLVS